MVEACTNCPSRRYCHTLCPEAELYVKQDEVYQRELPIGLPSYGKMVWPSNLYGLTDREKRIATLLLHGLSREEIHQVLGITKRSLRGIIHRLKKKCDGFLPLVEEEK